VVIERFCEAMWLEAGLAEASVASYRRDLQLAERLCAKPVSDFSAADVQAVLAQLLDLQRKASSMARMRASLFKSCAPASAVRRISPAATVSSRARVLRVLVFIVCVH